MAFASEGRIETALAPAVRAEQIGTLYRQSLLILALNPINACIVSAVLWPGRRPGARPLILGWILVSTLVSVARALVRASYLRANPAPEQAPLWARRTVVGAAVAGALWGVACLLFYDATTPATELILVVVIAGATAGAAGTLAHHLPAFFAFAAPAILALAARLFAEGDYLHVAMGVLALVYAAAVTIAATNTNRAVAASFRLRFENQDLLERLSRAQVSLEEANRTLEQRVAERGAALERQAEALREAQRMESLGLLAGGVAHDFNNLLTVMLGNALLVLAESGVSEAARGAVEEIRSAAERAASLVRQLLAFSRRQPREPRILDLNKVVSDVQSLLARLIGEHIELVVSLVAGPALVEADPAQVEQVIVNLATNARDAMAAGGKLTIDTEVVEVSGWAAPAPVVAPGMYVVLSARDTGVGMDPTTRRMAFHPFFTTKEVGQGTGLGLATVYGIVEQSGGHVLVDSEPGRGSRFRVFLPRAQAAAAEDAAAPRAGSAPRPAATVLLVEDEPLVLRVSARALTAAGFEVIGAESGQQALERARAHEGPIDLLVTDVVMGGMGGRELARALAADRPGIRVLFVSGYGRDVVLPAADVNVGVDFLEKPFTPGALVERVSRLCAAPGPRVSPPVAEDGPPRTPHRSS
jgi:signal transduction histidine kinase/CheY-like chemotaxis protein